MCGVYTTTGRVEGAQRRGERQGPMPGGGVQSKGGACSGVPSKVGACSGVKYYLLISFLEQALYCI